MIQKYMCSCITMLKVACFLLVTITVSYSIEEADYADLKDRVQKLEEMLQGLIEDHDNQVNDNDIVYFSIILCKPNYN